MSPWLNNLLTPACDVLISSHELALLQAGKRLASVPVAPEKNGEALNSRVTQAIRDLVNAAPYKNTRHTNVWLSHSLATHAVVRLDIRAMKPAEILTTLKAYWEDALGTPASTLAVTSQLQSDGLSVLSSCCATDLLAAIQSALRGANWTTKNVAPHIAKIWNASRKQIGPRNCCMLVLQDKVLSIGLQHNKQWAAWTSEGCESHEWSELANRVARFCRSTGLIDSQSISVWVHSSQTTGTPNFIGLDNWALLNTAQQTGLSA